MNRAKYMFKSKNLVLSKLEITYSFVVEKNKLNIKRR